MYTFIYLKGSEANLRVTWKCGLVYSYYISCPSFNVAVHVEGKVTAGLKDCASAAIARHLSTEKEVMGTLQANILETKYHSSGGKPRPSLTTPSSHSEVGRLDEDDTTDLRFTIVKTWHSATFAKRLSK